MPKQISIRRPVDEVVDLRSEFGKYIGADEFVLKAHYLQPMIVPLGIYTDHFSMPTLTVFLLVPMFVFNNRQDSRE